MVNNEPSTIDRLILERILQSLETIGGMTARLVALESICNRLDKVVTSGNGVEPLTVQMIRVREDITQIKNLMLDFKKGSSENIKGQWAFKSALVQSLAGLLGGSLAVALLKFFGK